MKKNLYNCLFLISLSLPAFTFAQAETFVFEGNNFRWTQTTNGSLFYNESEGMQGLEVPIDSLNHTIFASTLWIGGVDESNELKISFRRFCQNDNENCYENWGPLKLDESFATSDEVADYNMIWFVTYDQIEIHIAFAECINDPSCDESVEFPDYDIPEDFTSWPAEGDEGFAENLAPYTDFNNNGIYDPENGDYPAICGDFSSYAIWNDIGANGASSDGNEIGLEVHTTVYGYDSEQGSEFNTLFVQHKLINRGSFQLTETYAGLWTDFDIGNYSDDYVATEVSRSMFYGYNGGIFDAGSDAGPGYGFDVPAMGVKVLSGPLTDVNGIDDGAEYQDFYANETSGFNDGIVDNEKLGLYSSMYYNNGLPPMATQDPQLDIEYYNYMRSIWRDETHMSFGGIGYEPGDVAITLANYVFPGTSDPLFAGTNGEDPMYADEGGWTEYNAEIPSGDRRMVGSSGPFTFAPGDVQYIDLAYIFARESFDDEETVIETLQRFADEVEGMQCDPLPAIVLSADQGQERKPLQVYPNPSNETIFFELNEASGQLALIDITGKIVRQKTLTSGQQKIDVSDLAEGVYIIQVQASQSVYHGKIMINR
ncbi:MAG TPA: T9SS type A sorting domain-containing protein [Cryomorphaceae bacterium]|nr:T9SS type A sorting domain-containing protein [Cryomorphaceae bacterium]